jgi:hypothetical protein
MPSPRRHTASLAMAVMLLVAQPLITPVITPVLAQDAGVSGIPPGPGNVNGLNGSIRDPSGIGNAAKMPPLPQQIPPMTPPVAAPYPSRGAAAPRLRYIRPQESPRLSKRARQQLERAQIKENDRLLRKGATSICRGC